jgi:hypothetical protein
MLAATNRARASGTVKGGNVKVRDIALVTVALAGFAGGPAIASGKHRDTTDAWSKVAPAEDAEVFEQVAACRQRGDFDGAVAVALKGVQGRPPDDFLLQTVADTYFQRAQADPAQRERWITLAVKYSEQALQANPSDVVNVFNVGESYLAAAMNLGKPRGCSYYDKSLGVFERLKTNPVLKGESATVEGQQVPMEPYRQKLDNHIKQARLMASGCPAVPGKQ